MKVAITDPALLAAGSDGTSGSNGNIANLSAVANAAVSNGMTPSGGLRQPGFPGRHEHQ